MTDTPDTGQLRDRIADALRTASKTGWAENRAELAARNVLHARSLTHAGETGAPGHHYDSACALCAADVEALADAVLAVVQPELDRARAGGMREAAAMLRKYCPTHGTADTCLMDCHCAGAEEINRDARATAPTAPTT